MFSSLLDSVLSATSVNGSRPASGARIVSEQHDAGRINWAAGLSDPGEMIACGYLPEARRRSGESDEAYQARLLAMDLPRILGPERFAKLLKAAQGRASLATRNGKVCMFGAGAPWWHGLGVRVDQVATSAEAMKLAGLDAWDLKKVEQYIDFNDQRVKTGCFAIVRGDTGSVLTKGTSVGSRYRIVSNEELFDFLDAVVDGVHTRYDTAGAIGNGEKVWMLASMPEGVGEVVPGDEVRPYVLLGASHDGSGSINCLQTSERVVCANTYRNALNGSVAMRIRHTSNVQEKIKAARKALGLADRAAARFLEDARTLARKSMPNPESMFNLVLDDVVDVTIAETKVRGGNGREVLDAILSINDVDERQNAEVRYELAKKRRADLLETILDTYQNERCNGMSAIRGTAWAAVNAVSEAFQHTDALRHKGTDRQRRENHMESVVDGRAQEVTQLAVKYAMAS